MRCYMLRQAETQPHIGIGRDDRIYQMYRLLAVAKYEERYVIPACARGELPAAAAMTAMGCSLSVDGGPGMYESVRSGGQPYSVPIAVESFHALQHAGSAATGSWPIGQPPYQLG